MPRLKQFGNPRAPAISGMRTSTAIKRSRTTTQVVIGDPAFPQVRSLGINLNAGWKVHRPQHAVVQSATQSSFQLTNEASLPFFNGAKIFEEQSTYWTPENRNAKYPVIMPSPSTNSQQVSSFWQKDGSYIRLKNIELGYSLPANVMSRLRMSNIRLYLAAQNLLTFSAEKYLDPEIGVSSASKRARYYFQQKVLSFGLNVNF